MKKPKTKSLEPNSLRSITSFFFCLSENDLFRGCSNIPICFQGKNRETVTRIAAFVAQKAVLKKQAVQTFHGKQSVLLVF